MSVAELNVDQVSWLGELHKLRAQRKELEIAEKNALAQIRAMAADAEVLMHGGVVVAYDKPVVSRRIDSKLLRDNFPEAAEACTTETVARRFTLAEGVA